MTAHAMTGDRERCLDAGMDAYVSKPLHFGDVMSTIEGLFSAPPDSGGAPPPAAAPVQSAPRAAVNEETLLADFAGNRKLLAEVIAVFLDEAVTQIDALHTAVASRNGPAIAAAAHALKGSVGLFSRGRAYEAARALELAARGGDIDQADARCSEIARELARVQADLKAMLTTL